MDSELITFYGKILNKNKFYVDDVKVPEELYYKIKKKCEEERKIIEENQRLKEVIEEVREYINNYDVFKEFSFPIMKRHEENQVKSSIKYEFDMSIKKDVLQILDKVKGEDND